MLLYTQCLYVAIHSSTLFSSLYTLAYTSCLEWNVLALVVSLSARLNLFTASIVYSDVLLSSSALDSQCTSDSVIKISALNYILEMWLCSMMSSCCTSSDVLH